MKASLILANSEMDVGVSRSPLPLILASCVMARVVEFGSSKLGELREWFSWSPWSRLSTPITLAMDEVVAVFYSVNSEGLHDG